VDRLICLSSLHLDVGNETCVVCIEEVTKRPHQIAHLRRRRTCMRRHPDLLLAINLITQGKQENKLLGNVWHCSDPHASGCGHPSGVAQLLQPLEVIGLSGATDEVLVRWLADNIEKQGMLGVNVRGLVGLPAEYVESGSIDRALLQQGIP
jgi:hypothetical protein